MPEPLFFHNAIGGYHGAKPRRYEELYDFFSTHQIAGVMDMLNVKYLLIQQNNQQNLIKNPNVLGIAWAVDSLLVAATADGVLESMKSMDFSNQAVVLKSEFPANIPVKYDAQKMDKIELINNHPTHLKYEFEASGEQLLVFSEMYYPMAGPSALTNKKQVFSLSTMCSEV